MSRDKMGVILPLEDFDSLAACVVKIEEDDKSPLINVIQTMNASNEYSVLRWVVQTYLTNMSKKYITDINKLGGVEINESFISLHDIKSAIQAMKVFEQNARFKPYKEEIVSLKEIITDLVLNEAYDEDMVTKLYNIILQLDENYNDTVATNLMIFKDNLYGPDEEEKQKEAKSVVVNIALDIAKAEKESEAKENLEIKSKPVVNQPQMDEQISREVLSVALNSIVTALSASSDIKTNKLFTYESKITNFNINKVMITAIQQEFDRCILEDIDLAILELIFKVSKEVKKFNGFDMLKNIKTVNDVTRILTEKCLFRIK